MRQLVRSRSDWSALTTGAFVWRIYNNGVRPAKATPYTSMRGALIFLCLALWAAADARPQTEEDAHFEGQKARLESLKEWLANMKAEVDKRMERVKMVEKEMKVMEHTIAQAEPTGCDDEHEFQCGMHNPKCISRLLVCDSYADCEDQSDEGDHCRVYTPGGSIWEGKVEEDSCTAEHPEEIRLTIESYKIIDYLRSFPEITATVDMNPHSPDFDPATSMHVKGHMDLMPGDNVMYFGAQDNNGLAFECIFDGVDDSQCHGHILHESSHEICAHFLLHRVDSYATES